MPDWTLVDIHPTEGRTFRRPLDLADLRYVWLGLFNGTGDGMHHAEFRLVNGSRDAHLFSTANIERAWLSTKRRYPILGVTLQGHNAPLCLEEATNSEADGYRGDDADNTGFKSHPHFVVREHNLSVLHPGEIVFEEVAGADEVQQRIAAIYDGPRPLSTDFLARLYIFRETDPKRTDTIHLIALVSHCITDRIGGETLVRCFFDTLARGQSANSEPAQAPLEDRLGMEVSFKELEPMHLRSLSPAVRRWRRAIGAIIFQLKWKNLQGGHTLPWHRTRSTSYVPGRSAHIFISLSHEESTVVLANCRLHNITFGNAFHVLAQVAMTRVLCRRYLRGEISEEEWTYRKRQPHYTMGPINLRPRLDKTWYNKGGGGEVLSPIGLFYYQLPFMPLGAAMEKYPRHEHNREYNLSDGAPPFSDLLTLNRFLHRSELIKKQATAFFNHPLLFEIILGACSIQAARAKFETLQWMKRVDARGGSSANGEDDDVLPITDMPVVFAHGGSSVGNIDLITPSEYPLPPTHPLSPYSPVPHPAKAGYIAPPLPLPESSAISEADNTPKIVIDHTKTLVHVRPSELFLATSSSGGRLSMFVYYDANVFEEGVVREWLSEVREATLWYLGRTHAESAHKLQGHDSGANGRTRHGKGMGANL